MIVLNKRIRKLDSRKIVKVRTISGIIKEEKIFIYSCFTSICGLAAMTDGQ